MQYLTQIHFLGKMRGKVHLDRFEMIFKDFTAAPSDHIRLNFKLATTKKFLHKGQSLTYSPTLKFRCTILKTNQTKSYPDEKMSLS